MNRITEEQFYQLLSLKLSGDATTEELSLLQEQLVQNPQWQFLYDQMMKPPAPLSRGQEHTQQAYAAHFVKMKLQGMLDDSSGSMAADPGGIPALQSSLPPFKKSSYRPLYLMGAAAAILGIIVLFRFTGNRSPLQKHDKAFNEIVTKKGSRSNVKLPDGTQVWLNADSKLSYAENFNTESREISLVGEAYFDVQHDGNHPFVIHTGKETIVVLGTAFNVRNYPQDKSLETTLIRGKIEVTIKDRPEEKIILKPNEKLTISKVKDSSWKTNIYSSPVVTAGNNTTGNTAIPVAVKKDSLVAETAWLVDKMVFINQPMKKIAEELERHFAVTIIFKNPKVEEYRYTGVFDNISLETVLTILRASKKINYSIAGKNVMIQ